MPTTPSPSTAPQPLRPILGWRSFRPDSAPTLPSVEALPHVLLSSGRAALYQALQLLKVGAGDEVLVPTYHCPTMVTPALMLGARPRFYALGADGLPLLESLGASRAARAIIVPHLFGRAQSLAGVRQWCDSQGVALIEDCAHCYFGAAGERAVGGWGDYAAASATKFLPLPEAGLLASATRPLAPPDLRANGLMAQLKGLIDLLEWASRFKRLPGLNGVLGALFALKNRGQAISPPSAAQSPAAVTLSAEALMAGADMGRIQQRALWISRLMLACLPRSRVIAQRQRNGRNFSQRFAKAVGARPLFDAAMADAAYVFPLLIEDVEQADRVYHALRQAGHAVFRWDVIWPGTPVLAGDHGGLWQRQVLQFLCHQDLDDAAIDAAADAALALLKSS